MPRTVTSGRREFGVNVSAHAVGVPPSTSSTVTAPVMVASLRPGVAGHATGVVTTGSCVSTVNVVEPVPMLPAASVPWTVIV